MENSHTKLVIHSATNNENETPEPRIQRDGVGQFIAETIESISKGSKQWDNKELTFLRLQFHKYRSQTINQLPLSPNWTQMKILNICQAPIETLPDDVMYLFRQLKTLNLSKTKLKRLPSDITKVSSLKSIDVSNTQIMNIPKDLFIHLSKLKSLNLSKTKVTKLHRNIGYATKLKFLNISGCNITDIPWTIGFCHALSQFDIFKCGETNGGINIHPSFFFTHAMLKIPRIRASNWNKLLDNVIVDCGTFINKVPRSKESAEKFMVFNNRFSKKTINFKDCIASAKAVVLSGTHRLMLLSIIGKRELKVRSHIKSLQATVFNYMVKNFQMNKLISSSWFIEAFKKNPPKICTSCGNLVLQPPIILNFNRSLSHRIFNNLLIIQQRDGLGCGLIPCRSLTSNFCTSNCLDSWINEHTQHYIREIRESSLYLWYYKKYHSSTKSLYDYYATTPVSLFSNPLKFDKKYTGNDNLHELVKFIKKNKTDNKQHGINNESTTQETVLTLTSRKRKRPDKDNLDNVKQQRDKKRKLN